MDDYADQPYRVVIDNWEQVIDAPCALDAYRFAVGEWSEEFGEDVIWTGRSPVTESRAGRAGEGETLADLPVNHVEYDFATVGGNRYRVHVYEPDGI